MAKQLIDIGTSANKGDGDALRTAFRKINDNFNELYAASTLDPNAIGTGFIPDTDATYDLGSTTKRWADLHISDFIYLNNARIEVTSGGALLVNGGAPTEVQDTIGSVFADDSTLLVDGVNGFIPTNVLEGDISNYIRATDVLIESSESPGSVTIRHTGIGGITLDASTSTNGITMQGDVNAADLNVTNVNNYDTSPININHSGVNSLIITSTDINVNTDIRFATGTTVNFLGSTAINLKGDISGNVFAEDSTLLVDGVNGKIVGDVLNSRVVTELVDAPTDDLYVTAVNDGTLYLGTTNTRTVTIGASDTTVYVNGDADSIIAGGQFIGDLKGSVFGDDSTVLVDSVNGKIVGDVENNSVITGRVKSQDDIDLYVYAGGTGSVILAGQSDVSIGHTSGQTDIYGDVEFNNGTTAFQSGNDVTFNCPVKFTQSAPASSIGVDGDLQGAVAFDSNYIYYCTADYDGVANIWKRVAWSADTW